MIVTGGILEKIGTLADKTVKITIATQELTPEIAGQLFAACQTFGFFAWKQQNFDIEDHKIFEAAEADLTGPKKTQSQRIRHVLYRNWEQNNEGYDDFNLFYQYKTEKYITFLKNKLL